MNQLLTGDDGDSELETEMVMPLVDPEARKKIILQAEKKAKKAVRRAQREGRGGPTAGQKECDVCGKSFNLLVRCMYNKGQVDREMVCGECRNVASGGVVDGDAGHPHYRYRYGGLHVDSILSNRMEDYRHEDIDEPFRRQRSLSVVD